MTFFVELHRDLIISICADWLQLIHLNCLDTSYCSSFFRQQLLDIFQSNEFVHNNEIILTVNDTIRHFRSGNTGWFFRRKIKLSTINILSVTDQQTLINSSCYSDTSSKSFYIRCNNLSHIISIYCNCYIYHESAKPFILKIVNNCTHLKSLRYDNWSDELTSALNPIIISNLTSIDLTMKYNLSFVPNSSILTYISVHCHKIIHFNFSLSNSIDAKFDLSIKLDMELSSILLRNHNLISFCFITTGHNNNWPNCLIVTLINACPFLKSIKLLARFTNNIPPQSILELLKTKKFLELFTIHGTSPSPIDNPLGKLLLNFEERLCSVTNCTHTNMLLEIITMGRMINQFYFQKCNISEADIVQLESFAKLSKLTKHDALQEMNKYFRDKNMRQILLRL